MNITAIRFIKSEPVDSMVAITADTGRLTNSVYPNPKIPEIEVWEQSNTIVPYDKYHGQTLDDVKAAKLKELRASMSARLYIHYDQPEQLNMALDLYPPEVKAQFGIDHGLMMVEYERVRDAVQAATDTAEIDAAMDSINWPLAEVA